MSTKEPEPEPDTDSPEPDPLAPASPASDPTALVPGSTDPAEPTATSQRREPPRPGDLPLTNIPPPAGSAEAVTEDQSVADDDDDPFSDIAAAIRALLGDDAEDDAADDPAVDADDPGDADDPPAPGEPASDADSPEIGVLGATATGTATEGADAGVVIGEAGDQADDGAGGVDAHIAALEIVPGEPVDGPPAPEQAEAVPSPDVAASGLRSRRTSRRRATRVVVGALVLAVLAGSLAVAKAQQVGDLTTQRNDRRAIERVAAAFGSAYLSYDFEHADDSGRAVRALATIEFARSYAATSAPGIQELFSSRQTTTHARTKEVFVGAVHPRRARALVVVDVTASSPTEGEQRLDDVSFVLDLTRTTGGWRVARVARAPQPELVPSRGG